MDKKSDEPVEYVEYPIIYKVLATSQVVVFSQEFLKHQPYCLVCVCVVHLLKMFFLKQFGL